MEGVGVVHLNPGVRFERFIQQIDRIVEQHFVEHEVRRGHHLARVAFLWRRNIEEDPILATIARSAVAQVSLLWGIHNGIDDRHPIRRSQPNAFVFRTQFEVGMQHTLNAVNVTPHQCMRPRGQKGVSWVSVGKGVFGEVVWIVGNVIPGQIDQAPCVVNLHPIVGLKKVIEHGQVVAGHEFIQLQVLRTCRVRQNHEQDKG